MSCVSFARGVASEGYYLAMVSTNVETSKPDCEEVYILRPGITLCEPIVETFVSVDYLSAQVQ